MYFILPIQMYCSLNIETNKDSKDEIHETHRAIHFIRRTDLSEDEDLDDR